jgi:hypothetical protein
MALPLGGKVGGVTVVSNDALQTPSQVALTLTVDQAIPVVATEPAFTGGTSNTLSWTNLGVGIEYEVQRDTTGTFPSPASSGWIGGTSHTFSALTHAITYNYRVHSRLAGDNTWTSEWSPTVSSTQDAQPPAVVLAIPSGVFTGLSAYAMLGTSTDLSGVASLQFVPAVGAPINATTSNQFANWGVSLPGLVLGGNAFTVMARDTAVPANTSNVSWSLTRLDPNAPAGSSGVSPLLAAAMNVDPNAANALKQTSAVTGQVVNPGDGKSYLTVTFRRRVVPAGFSYFIEISPDLKVWTNAGAAAVLISTEPEGVTELRTYRIQPALSDAAMNFVRVRVQVD